MAEDAPEPQPSHADRVRPSRNKSVLSQDREDALEWLAREVANVAREAQLRIDDATQFVTEYARGRMSPQEFRERDNAYMFRWGDPLKGLADSRGMSNEDIVSYIDESKAAREKKDSRFR